jgi:hypothetical protein
MAPRYDYPTVHGYDVTNRHAHEVSLGKTNNTVARRWAVDTDIGFFLRLRNFLNLRHGIGKRFGWTDLRFGSSRLDWEPV